MKHVTLSLLAGATALLVACNSSKEYKFETLTIPYPADYVLENENDIDSGKSLFFGNHSDNTSSMIVVIQKYEKGYVDATDLDVLLEDTTDTIDNFIEMFLEDETIELADQDDWQIIGTCIFDNLTFRDTENGEMLYSQARGDWFEGDYKVTAFMSAATEAERSKLVDNWKKIHVAE